MIVELCQELLSHLKQEPAYPPPAGQRVWDWFWELDKGRQAGFNGGDAISWSDLGEWQRITGASPSSWELEAIYRMGIYRVNPEYNPIPKKQEPVSLLKDLKALQDSYQKDP